jgi:hypothetical protein
MRMHGQPKEPDTPCPDPLTPAHRGRGGATRIEDVRVQWSRLYEGEGPPIEYASWWEQASWVYVAESPYWGLQVLEDWMRVAPAPAYIGLGVSLPDNPTKPEAILTSVRGLL